MPAGARGPLTHTGGRNRLADTNLEPRLDSGLPTDPQVHMGTRKTRTNTRSHGSLRAPLRLRPFVSALSIQPVKAGYPRPVVRPRGCHRPSRPPRDVLAGRITIAHATSGRTSVHPRRHRRRHPL